MPLLLRAGGIVPERTNIVTNDVQNPLDQVTLFIGAGANGDYQLYEDQGDGAEFAHGAFAKTDIAYREWGNQRQLSIVRVTGQYPGLPATRQWTAEFVGVNNPHSVSVPGIGALPQTVSGIGWSYNVPTRTLEVRVEACPIYNQTTIIVQ
jgi:hypothetical protein